MITIVNGDDADNSDFDDVDRNIDVDGEKQEGGLVTAVVNKKIY